MQDLSGLGGYIHFNLESKVIGLSTKKRLINRFRADSRLAKLPLYPNGWFHLLESASLGKNEAKYVSALGKSSHSRSQGIRDQFKCSDP